MRLLITVLIFLASVSRASTNSMENVLETGSNLATGEIGESFIGLAEYVVSEVMTEGGNIPVKNITCLERHCSSQIEGCIANDVCRKNMMCSARCGTDDSSCRFKCSESYQDPSIDAMVRCMFVDPGCLAFPDPDPINNATCRKPTNTVSQVN